MPLKLGRQRSIERRFRRIRSIIAASRLNPAASLCEQPGQPPPPGPSPPLPLLSPPPLEPPPDAAALDELDAAADELLEPDADPDVDDADDPEPPLELEEPVCEQSAATRTETSVSLNAPSESSTVTGM